MRRSNERQEAIRSIVRGQSVRTQGELVEALAERGFACTQSTISRDVSEMHLRKLDDLDSPIRLQPLFIFRAGLTIKGLLHLSGDN